ncbi:MAG: alpha/beta fold hydrolase [Pseudomonadota bacterium]
MNNVIRTTSQTSTNPPLAIRTIGNGPPVICLHALGHDSGDFDPLVARLSDRFRFILVDWPGHGAAGLDMAPVSANRYAELLDLALPALNLDTPIVIGNSIGGGAAILYASRHPVRGVVLCNSAGLLEVTPAATRICNMFARLFSGGERGAFWFPAFYALYYRIVLVTPAARARRSQIVANGPRLAKFLREAWQSFGRPDADIRATAASLTAPVWVAWAIRDKVLQLKASLPAIKMLKNYRLSKFDAGHSAFVEQPEAFAAQFAEWAAGLPVKSS